MKPISVFVSLALTLSLAACDDKSATGNASNQSTNAEAGNAGGTTGQKWRETVVVTPEGGHRMGNPDAPVKLIEYGARSCPVCGAFARDGVPALVEKYVASGKVSYEFRDFMVHGAPDLALALIGACTGPESFFPLMEQTYQNQEAILTKLQAIPVNVQQQWQNLQPGPLMVALAENSGMIEFAMQRGLPEPKVRQCLTDKGKIDALVKMTDDAAKAGVAGTPTFMINGERANAITWQELEPLLKAAGA